MENVFRRTVMTRHRSITALEAVLVDSYHFRLRLTTQAGAYVKEFVHGDFGRTKPNLTIILNRFVDILELDVLVCDYLRNYVFMIQSFFLLGSEY